MTRKILVIPDVHAPYHDEAALQLIERVAKKEKPTHVVVIGDLADCHAISSHTKTAERRVFWQEEVESAAACLTRIRKMAPVLTMFEGNHELRLERYIMEKAPELMGTHATIRELLGVEKKEWHAYRTHALIGNMAFAHDLGHAGPNSLKQTLDAFGGCIVFGHTHRLGTHYDGNVDGSHRVAMNVGWIGDERHINYMHAAKMRAWQKGFGWITQVDGLSWVQAVPIINHSCTVNGKYYKL